MGEEEEENHRSLGVERQVVLKRGFSQHDTQRKEQFVWCLNTLVGQACSVWGDPRPSTWPLSQAPARVPTAGFCSLGTPIPSQQHRAGSVWRAEVVLLSLHVWPQRWMFTWVQPLQSPALSSSCESREHETYLIQAGLGRDVWIFPTGYLAWCLVCMGQCVRSSSL